MSPKLIRPARLRAGARIGLITPSGPLLEVDHAARGAELCRALGYQPVLRMETGDAYGYLAGRDDARLASLNAALADPTLDAVWCLRGGNGLNRIIDRVDFAGFAAHPKPVIGYSDITVLLLALLTRTGIVTFHGPMARFAMTDFSRRHFDQVLATGVVPGVLGRVAPRQQVLVPDAGRIVTVVPGQAEGRVIGGNLTMVQALIGTEYFPDVDGAILFLEDIDEGVNRIDRMLAHLRLAGVLRRLAGVAIGHFSRMRRATPDGALGLDDVLRTHFGPLDIPVARGFPIGHVAEQWTLPLGVMARLDATAGELRLLEAAVT
jgi:muramoyltetrapeptide carboxypeptidase